ncbi:NAD(P)H-dependent oxidoreductase [Ciceribacter sp. L1K22]|uniref:flavodoxin family protein n=1 Tax=Ciceribacter sp. L1K22 TaxID=2820275 RepID=UPI001ABE0BA0|nr:NAD(P)H-dependent oxidoreductase [Ciceribacter sp. L1K22]
MTLKALAFNATLKPSGNTAASSTDFLLEQFRAAFARSSIELPIIRLVDHDIKPGVSADEGGGDAWPSIRQQLMDADILVMATPIWMGQPSSVCKRALERMDAFLGETDDSGRMPTFGKVALVGVVGNEDGAHHVSAELYQALNDVGYTLPPNAVDYWVGEAMSSVNLVDLDEIPEKVKTTVDMAVSNALHLARLLSEAPYPPPA